MDCITFFGPGQVIVRPTPDQPGTPSQQAEAMALYDADPSRRLDREAAWARARALAMPHARRGYLRERRAGQ